VTGNSRKIEVQPGDTLYSLAQRHGASISELMSLNGLRSPAVHPGQKIILPERPTAMASAVRQTPVSKTNSTRVAALTESADARVSQREQPAAVVKELSPEPRQLASAEQDEAASSPGDTYTMKNGDSLYGIAVRHRISLAQLQEINNITDPRKVRAGTVLKLPSSSAAPTRVALTPDRRPQLGSHADTTTAPQTAAAPANDSGEAVAKPTIINAPASAPGQRVASLDNTGTASDAAPSPLTLPSPSAEGESGKTSEPQGGGATKAETVGKFRWPVRGKVITGFGQQPDGSHSDGIKLAVPLGTEVHAAESGVVAYAGNELKGYGNLVLLRHDNGWITAYAHNDELSVKRGDRVRRGQVIAKAGNTGSTDRPQLHFELRQGSSPVDPVPHLERL
jgi:murein DD-endopeptidase MepM/ murein hydrolase activator NlpD